MGDFTFRIASGQQERINQRQASLSSRRMVTDDPTRPLLTHRGWLPKISRVRLTMELPTKTKLRWWDGVTRYQWLVLAVAWMGWVFDAMDSTLYVLVMNPALTDLLHTDNQALVHARGGIILSIFLVGWALGGVLFGVLADYIGRTRTMVITILVYAIFTGLAALSHTWWQLGLFRFLTALGVGGEWAAGAALVAEVFPERARTEAAGVLHSAWAVGFFFAALVNLGVGRFGWRYVFVVGIAPAIVAIYARRRVGEPERWHKVQEARRQRAAQERLTLTELLAPGVARSTLVGASLALVAVLALWSATYWSPERVQELLQSRRLSAAQLGQAKSYAAMALNAGALIGYLSFAPISERIGRKRTFYLFYLGSLVMVPTAFLKQEDYDHFVMVLPALGFFNNGIFSGFAIYFPEIFSTRLRTTGAGFCFNVGRVGAAVGPWITGLLTSALGSVGKAASAVGLVYLLGLMTIPFAEETRGKELPE